MPQIDNVTIKRAHSSNSSSEDKAGEELQALNLKCVFCKILDGKLPGSTVYEDDTCRIIMDIHPIRPGHVMIIPRQHYQNIMDMPSQVATHMMELAHQLTAAVTKDDIQDDVTKYDGVNLMWNNGRVAWQTVLHAHLHVIPRRKGDGWSFLFGIFQHLLSLMGLMPAANRNELDRLAGIFGERLTKHIKSS